MERGDAAEDSPRGEEGRRSGRPPDEREPEAEDQPGPRSGTDPTTQADAGMTGGERTSREDDGNVVDGGQEAEGRRAPAEETEEDARETAEARGEERDPDR